jgi:hypothetical protein
MGHGSIEDPTMLAAHLEAVAQWTLDCEKLRARSALPRFADGD